MPRKPKTSRVVRPQPKRNGGWATTTTTRHERGYDSAWMRLRARVLEAWPICYVCAKAKSTHVDHVIPKSEGGTDDIVNLRGICAVCHGRKSSAEGHERRRRST